ncbi:MAG: tryptophan 2,3-dioxygenase family protein, partial [Bacteroidota bacterium]
ERREEHIVPCAAPDELHHDGQQPPLDYAAYLGLDALLAAQTPATRVPDERVFIVIHQLCELVFKQMTFDLGVLAATFRALGALDEDDFEARALELLPDERGPSGFWRPALTAAARLRHCARRLLPVVMQLVGRGAGDDVLFSTLEYQHFRDALAPASGFQTAQLRLIQRALGKGPLFGVRVFPGDTFAHHYQQASASPARLAGACPHVSLGDPLILRNERARAFPETTGTTEANPAADVPHLDDLAHGVLARLAPAAEGLVAPPAVRRLRPDDLDRSVARFRATLGSAGTEEDVAHAGSATATFRADLEAAIAVENARRDGFDAARRGAHALHVRHPQTCLAFTLDRITATDAALHEPATDSFLTVHRKTVRRHVTGDGGTGGGGLPYLVTSQRFLLPLFPALVAYADLGIGATGDDADGW